jgi:hypothetical protein
MITETGKGKSRCADMVKGRIAVSVRPTHLLTGESQGATTSSARRIIVEDPWRQKRKEYRE